MRSVDLALYADTLAAEASALAARLERARGRLRRVAIEREARSTLAGETVARLEGLGLLRTVDSRTDRTEIAEIAAALSALEELQAWVERRLYAVREEDYAMSD